MAPETPAETIFATYNVLAEAHIRPEWFPLVDPKHFVTETRYPRVVKRAIGLDADVLCLQEVDDALFRKLKSGLEPLDYRGFHTKYDGKPDGVATFMRWPHWRAFDHRVLRYDDAAWNGGKRSGRLAHLFRLGVSDRSLAFANAHLKWDDPSRNVEERLGFAEARMLAAGLVSMGARNHVICGDLNVMPDDAVLGLLREEGFADAHPAATATFNSSDAVGGARKIDYVLHTDGLVAGPLPTPEVTDATPLPSDTEPSDHVPLAAAFRFAD